VFLLADCQPDITQIMDILMQKTNTLMVKTGPLLDIDAGLNQLYAVAEIHIVAVENEVKELLWIIKKDFKGNISVCTRNFQKSEVQEFDFELQDKSMANAVYSLPLTFLYEPNVAIMKSGAFNLVGTTFGLKKLHANTHLYTSEQQIHFPGRVFRIINVLPYKKNAWQTLGLKKAHITTRNFKYSVAQLRKQTRLQDGGHDYLFFTTGTHGEPLIIHTRKARITRVKNSPRKAD
jgi:hypothetical protein